MLLDFTERICFKPKLFDSRTRPEAIKLEFRMPMPLSLEAGIEET